MPRTLVVKVSKHAKYFILTVQCNVHLKKSFLILDEVQILQIYNQV